MPVARTTYQESAERPHGRTTTNCRTELCVARRQSLLPLFYHTTRNSLLPPPTATTCVRVAFRVRSFVRACVRLVALEGNQYNQPRVLLPTHDERHPAEEINGISKLQIKNQVSNSKKNELPGAATKQVHWRLDKYAKSVLGRFPEAEQASCLALTH